MTKWEEAWQTGRTGWDAGDSAPALQEWLLCTDRPHTGRALVPGCGSGYDVFTLAKAGFDACGLDIAPSTVKRFEHVRTTLGIEATKAHIITDDFFAPAQDLGTFDLIYDYTFFCAIPPTRRQEWAKRMDALLHPDGILLTLIFPVHDIDDQEPSLKECTQPPYPVHPSVMRKLLKERFTQLELKAPKQSHPKRAGREFLASWSKK